MSRYINVFTKTFDNGPTKATHKIGDKYREMITIWPEKDGKPNVSINLDVFGQYVKDQAKYIYEKEEFEPKKKDKPIDIERDDVIDPENLPF